ncbi:MAG: adenylate kinase [Rhizobium sp.]|nr:MAG: adenylate kinase [Rhizobium sp.]
MSRIAILGNAGGVKSTLARTLSERHDVPHFEIDKLLWQENWVPAPLDVYEERHERIISEDSWVIDGLGHRNSIQARIDRATEIILIDMPLWMHFWLAAERQIAWQSGKLEHAPGGVSTMPPTRDLFRTIWEIDQDWMPGIRRLCAKAESTGKRLLLIHSIHELDAYRQQSRP